VTCDVVTSKFQSLAVICTEKGSSPTKPKASKFLELSSNSVTLNLGTFSDGGWPMLYFVVEYKAR
jgi:hypothetical protein